MLVLHTKRGLEGGQKIVQYFLIQKTFISVFLIPKIGKEHGL